MMLLCVPVTSCAVPAPRLQELFSGATMEPFKDVSAVRDPVSLLEYLSKVRGDPPPMSCVVIASLSSVCVAHLHDVSPRRVAAGCDVPPEPAGQLPTSAVGRRHLPMLGARPTAAIQLGHAAEPHAVAGAVHRESTAQDARGRRRVHFVNLKRICKRFLQAQFCITRVRGTVGDGRAWAWLAIVCATSNVDSLRHDQLSRIFVRRLQKGARVLGRALSL
jgi:hypothetical protein